MQGPGSNPQSHKNLNYKLKNNNNNNKGTWSGGKQTGLRLSQHAFDHACAVGTVEQFPAASEGQGGCWAEQLRLSPSVSLPPNPETSGAMPLTVTAR